MKSVSYIVYIFIICCSFEAISQEPVQNIPKIDTLSPRTPIQPTGRDVRQNVVRDTFTSSDFSSGTFPGQSLPSDTIGGPKIDIPMSTDGIDNEVEHGARDTQWVDVATNTIHLIGDAYIKYQNNEIKAGYIIFDFVNKEAYAESIQDSLGRSQGIPSFKTDGQEFTYKKLKYNFNTQKGIVYEAFTQQGELFVHGGVTKFVSKTDSLYVDDVVFNKNALITTCDLEHPHWGIRTTKLKMIPNKLAVIGPARLEMAGIPTPLFIPFAFMPIIGGQQSGIIFGGQEGFEFSEELGFGFQDIGYYWALNDYMDLRLTADIYSRGSWGIHAATNYKKRYKFRGNVLVNYSRQLIETEGQLEPSINSAFSLRFSHNQESKAHPYMTVGGNFGFTLNDYDRRNLNDAASALNTSINSNFRISHTLPSIDAMTLNINIGHTQNTRTREITFTDLPSIELKMKTVYPFKKNRGGNKEKWFEKINLRYNSKFRNYVKAIDTTLFTTQTLDNFQSGVNHEADVGATFNVLKHFQLTPSVNYDEIWFLRTTEKSFNSDFREITFDADTGEEIVDVGRIDERLRTGFSTYRNINARVNLSTRIFGTALFKKGLLRGLRHQIEPSVGFSFSPSTERYLEVVEDTEGVLLEEYNPFQGGIFRVPTFTGKQMLLTYGVNNTFEGKYWSKKDEEEKKFKIFNSIRAGGNYNVAADSLNWSTVSVSGSARLFKNTNINLTGTWDPYIEQNGRRVNITALEDSGKILRFENFRMTVSTSWTIKNLRQAFQKKKSKKDREEDEEEEDDLLFDDEEDLRFGDVSDPFSSDDFTENSLDRPERNAPINPRNEEDDEKLPSLWEIFDNFRMSHNFTYGINQQNGENTGAVGANSIQMSGAFPLTQNWRVTVGNFSYDFVNKRFVYPTFGISRDLHCWTMNFNWQPARGTYQFFIAVKSPQFGNFLKYNYSQNRFDSVF